MQLGSAQAGGQEAHRAGTGAGQVGQEVEEQWSISTSSSSPISTSRVSSSSPRSSTLRTRYPRGLAAAWQWQHWQKGTSRHWTQSQFSSRADADDDKPLHWAQPRPGNYFRPEVNASLSNFALKYLAFKVFPRLCPGLKYPRSVSHNIHLFDSLSRGLMPLQTSFCLIAASP